MAGTTWLVSVLTSDERKLVAHARLANWSEVQTYCKMVRRVWPSAQILIWPPVNGAGAFIWDWGGPISG